MILLDLDRTLTQGLLVGRRRDEDGLRPRVCRLRDAGKEDPRQLGQDLLTQREFRLVVTKYSLDTYQQTCNYLGIIYGRGLVHKSVTFSAPPFESSKTHVVNPKRPIGVWRA